MLQGNAVDGYRSLILEARIALPARGQSLWPAFWMETPYAHYLSPIDSLAWPWTGEIDILEAINGFIQNYAQARVAAPEVCTFVQGLQRGCAMCVRRQRGAHARGQLAPLEYVLSPVDSLALDGSGQHPEGHRSRSCQVNILKATNHTYAQARAGSHVAGVPLVEL